MSGTSGGTVKAITPDSSNMPLKRTRKTVLPEQSKKTDEIKNKTKQKRARTAALEQKVSICISGI